MSASKVTVTEKIAIPTFPNASDAVQVTIVVPTGKLEPEDGEQVGPTVTPMSSDAVTLNVTARPAELEVEDVELDGTVTVGGVYVSPDDSGAGAADPPASSSLKFALLNIASFMVDSFIMPANGLKVLPPRQVPLG